MRIALLSVLMLSACSLRPDYQVLLDQYALNAATTEALPKYLTADALESAIKSAELVSALGLQQIGTAIFENLEVRNNSLLSACLDVSNVQFVDSQGQSVELENRVARQSVTVWLEDSSGSLKISRLETGGPC